MKIKRFEDAIGAFGLFWAVCFVLMMMFCSAARAQTAGATMPWVRPQFLDNTGLPLAGGKVCTYLAGTSTPQLTYQDSALGTPNANPVILDASGRPINGINPVNIFLSGVNYKFVLYSAGTDPLLCPGGGTLIWTQDNIGDIGQILKVNLATPGVSTGAALVAFQQTGAGTVAQTVQAKLQQYPAVADYSGANFGAKFAACAAALPATGGVCDARMFSGQQSIVTDVFAAIAHPTTLLLSCATELDLTHAQTINIGQVMILSDCQNPDLLAGQAPFTAGARIKATAALGNAMFTIAGPIQGFALRDLTLDCNSNSTYAVVADMMQAAHWTGLISITNCLSGGLQLKVSGITADVGAQNNTFEDLVIVNSPACIVLQGNDEGGGPSNANANFNTFGKVQCNYTTGPGIDCHNADSNIFHALRFFPINGSGVSVDLGSSAHHDCRMNEFGFLDTGVGGTLLARTGNTAHNLISDYALQNNGGVQPTIEGFGTGTVARLQWIDGNGVYHGTQVAGIDLTQSAAPNPFMLPQNHTLCLDSDVACVSKIFSQTGTNNIVAQSSGGFDFEATSEALFSCLTSPCTPEYSVNARGAGSQAALRWDRDVVNKYGAYLQADDSWLLQNAAGNVLLHFGHDYSVGTLPACVAGNRGAVVHVIDAVAPAFGAAPVGGGVAFAGVSCNGVGWTVYAI